MEWALVIAAFILGLALGYVARTIFARKGEAQASSKQLEQTRLELSQHKQEVHDHFDEQYAQLSALTEQLNKFNQRWNESSTTLSPNGNNKKLPTFAQSSDSQSTTKDDELTKLVTNNAANN
ncbi:ZapG family protein [Shewanella waksmanii]|uniref:ZapG family protein n=1 Tax=Shewanella waksmanii TaxID=213783 RepID=UPI003736A498